MGVFQLDVSLGNVKIHEKGGNIDQYLVSYLEKDKMACLFDASLQRGIFMPQVQTSPHTLPEKKTHLASLRSMSRSTS